MRPHGIECPRTPNGIHRKKRDVCAPPRFVVEGSAVESLECETLRYTLYTKIPMESRPRRGDNPQTSQNDVCATRGLCGSSLRKVPQSLWNARLCAARYNGPMPRRTHSPENSESENQITEVTRRAIFDFLTIGGHNYAGRLEEQEFLARLFDLKKMPSTDRRFENAAGDIWKHRVMNRDWPDDWVFYDGRFDLLHGPDETFLRFLCETVHPVVQPDPDVAVEMAKAYNEHLTKDGWEVVEKMRISDKPVYAARPAIAGAGVSVKAAKEVAFTLDVDYVSQQITRMESAINDDPELAIGTAKEFLETVCKTVLSECDVKYDKNEDLPKLVKRAVEKLKLVPEGLTNTAKAADHIGLLLKNLAAIGHHLAEIRNPFGTGHGKEATHKGLEPRHARPVVGAASTLGVFLFECHRGAD